jgi:hypothetical protein
VPNLAQIVTTKLNRENYVLWKTQIVPILRGALLMGFLDGTTPCPEKLIMETIEGAAVQKPNPEYLRWVQIDQSLLSGLLSTLTPDVLSSVTMLDTSRGVWTTLERLFSAATTSKVIQIRMQLTRLAKEESSAAAYFQKVKNLTDSMSAIGKPLGDEEIIAYLLSGLGEEYDSIAARTIPPSLSEVYE